ncbi:WhiB family transcriptional regulator [Streptosporangium jomthongense]|uniref:WhiB family transcriptional regulator n=1 Tax=Streptosporangium jomthongense TaxID=1193683 RepID=A0ABV8F3B4_9ACTN
MPLTACLPAPSPAMSLFDAAADPPPELADGALCTCPELHTGPASETAEERAARVQVAIEVCAECPVRVLCLARALQLRPTVGVWAGLDAEAVDWAEVARLAAAAAGVR